MNWQKLFTCILRNSLFSPKNSQLLSVYNSWRCPIKLSVMCCIFHFIALWTLNCLIYKYDASCLHANSELYARLPGRSLWTMFINYSHQMTPLHSAAGIDHLDTVICLVDKETDTKIKDNGVSQWEYTSDCKLVVQIQFVPTHLKKGLV